MLILASESPRRRELIKKITSNFTVIPSNIDESLLHIAPHDLPAELSKMKAYSVYSKYPNDEVLACDTVVIIDNSSAFRMILKIIPEIHNISFHIAGISYGIL